MYVCFRGKRWVGRLALINAEDVLPFPTQWHFYPYLSEHERRLMGGQTMPSMFTKHRVISHSRDGRSEARLVNRNIN